MYAVGEVSAPWGPSPETRAHVGVFPLASGDEERQAAEMRYLSPLSASRGLPRTGGSPDAGGAARMVLVCE